MKEETSVFDTLFAQISRRRGLELGAAGIMASLFPATALTETQTDLASQKEHTMADNTAVRPFRFEAPEAVLEDLLQRIKATKWPDREQVSDTSQGVQLATMQNLAKYWSSDYDWRKLE